MPIEIEYTSDGIGVISHAIGEVTDADVIESSNSIYADDNFSQLRYWIINRDRCTEYSVSLRAGSTISNMDKKAAKRNSDLCVAIISKTELEHIRSILYKADMLQGGFKTEVFRYNSEADKWLQKHIGIHYKLTLTRSLSHT